MHIVVRAVVAPVALMNVIVAPAVLVAQSTTRASSNRVEPFNVIEASIADVHAAMVSGRLTCRQLVQTYLDRIAAYDKQGPALNSIQTVNPRALAEADSLDNAFRLRQPRGTLHCVPVVVKDQVETKDMPTMFGSVLFKDFVPTRDATVVQRLRAAGAIIIAKATMGEFASRYVSSAAGVIRNAYDPTRQPSGSSGGTGAAIAANFALVGIGEDTGGSIRGPAAAESLVGLRPTVPLVSRFGMLPAIPTQDTMGPITRSVADATRILDVIAGYDPNDPLTSYTVGLVPRSYGDALVASALKGGRLGVLQTRHADSTAADSVEFSKVRLLFTRAIADLRALGADVIDSLRVPELPGRTITNDFETEEATDRYLAQHQNAPYKTLKDILLAGGVDKSRARSLMAYVNRSTREAEYGAFTLYREAMRVALLKIMADHGLDALIYATFDAQSPVIPPDILTNARVADKYFRGDNRPLSAVVGWPAITVPMGFTVDSMPAGLEFLGRAFSEERLFGFAFGYEQGTKHRRPPSTTPIIGR